MHEREFDDMGSAGYGEDDMVVFGDSDGTRYVLSLKILHCNPD
jgi:hypothetical protein